MKTIYNTNTEKANLKLWATLGSDPEPRQSADRIGVKFDPISLFLCDCFGINPRIQESMITVCSVKCPCITRDIRDKLCHPPLSEF